MAVYFLRVGHSEVFAAYAITVLSLPTAFAQPVVGWLRDRTSRAGVTIGCGLLGTIAFWRCLPLQQRRLQLGKAAG